MKRVMIGIIMAACVNTTTFAERDYENHKALKLKDGRTIVRIEVGDKKKRRYHDDEAEIYGRVWLLEKAVRELQDQVYELQDENRDLRHRNRKLERRQRQHKQTELVPVKLYACSLTTTFDGTFSAEANSRTKSIGQLMRKCENKAGSFWCRRKEVVCETRTDYIRK